ncbi:MAG: hypothetical protein C0522_07815 [Rhodocyclaceae bacterium]|jgi:hypothetical protein|nr:hypothetical protein [Rhodocyclaceae bacterium]
MNTQDKQQDAASAQIDDTRLSFDEAVAYVVQRNAAAFAVTPVFEEDDEESPSGARVFVLAADGKGGFFMRFIAGRFFSGAYAADDIYAADEIPGRVKELRFLPTRYEEGWFTDQVQVLIGKLVAASGTEAPQMPDYQGSPLKHAAAEVVFPVSMIGRGTKH